LILITALATVNLAKLAGRADCSFGGVLVGSAGVSA